jgi:alpha-galactosidase
MDDPETYERDTVRFEMLQHFGAFVTESSAHVSEYVPHVRTDPDRIAELTGRGAAERVPTATYLQGWTAESAERDQPLAEAEIESATVERSEEYASRIIHSLETDTTRRMNLNVPNEDGHITNLPTEACVEVPALVDGTGIRPCSVGDLPPQLAALCRSNVAVQERTVHGGLTGDREAVHQAVKLDPLSTAACTLPELHELTEELIAANADYLPELT